MALEQEVVQLQLWVDPGAHKYELLPPNLLLGLSWGSRDAGSKQPQAGTALPGANSCGWGVSEGEAWVRNRSA